MTYEEFLADMTRFIASRAKIPPARLQADTKLVESGIVDSLLLTELILYVEDALDCTIEVDNFKMSSFESIASIYGNYGK